MKRIGAGWQYAAYDLGNGTVRKVPRHPYAQAVKIGVGLLAGRCFSPAFLRFEQRRVNEGARRSLTLMERIPEEDRWLLGNPVRTGGLSYEQDRVRTLGEVMRTAPFEESSKLIDEYITHMQRMWTFGLSETSLNFMWNAGIDQQGRVVLIDFGELTDDKKVVAQQIETEWWRTQFVFVYFPGPVRDYLGRALKERLTMEQLDALWERAL